MKRYLSAIAAAAAAFTLGGLGTAFALPSSADEPWIPPADTIVRVTGDKANGFTIHYYDGSQISPPTDSEAFAECIEYDRYVDRERCKTEVRIWYRDLGQMKRAINWARYDSRYGT